MSSSSSVFAPGQTEEKRSSASGIGRAEAVDALILVADHEEVPGFLCQQLNDRVLHAGRVLRFVDAE